MAQNFNTIDSEKILSLDKSFDRLNGQPLDQNEIWSDLDTALTTYSATNKAYIGQTIKISHNGRIQSYIIASADGKLIPEQLIYTELSQYTTDLANNKLIIDNGRSVIIGSEVYIKCGGTTKALIPRKLIYNNLTDFNTADTTFTIEPNSRVTIDDRVYIYNTDGTLTPEQLIYNSEDDYNEEKGNDKLFIPEGSTIIIKDGSQYIAYVKQPDGNILPINPIWNEY